MTDAAASPTNASPAPEVLRLESSAQPMNYEVYFDLEPHVAAVEEWQSQEQTTPAVEGRSPRRTRSFHRLPPTKFRGQTKIHLAASTNLRALTLHALELDIESIAWAVRSEADEDIAPEDGDDADVSTDRSPSNAAGGGGTDAEAANGSSNGGGGGASTNNLVDLDLDVAGGDTSMCNGACSPHFPVPESAHNVSEWKLDPSTETVRFELGETIAENRQIVVFVSYTGKVNRTSRGLFMSDPRNDPFALATHLEPTNARRLYPCLDEPSFGSRFTLTVRAPEKQQYVLLGNTRVYSTTTDHGTPVRAAHQQATPAQGRKPSSNLVGGGIPHASSTQHLDATAGDCMPQLPEALAPSSTTAQQQSASVAAMLGDSTTDSESASTAAALCNTSAGDYRLYQFHTTPVVPSYLVAFVFARLHSISAETKSGVITRVFLPLNEPLENAWFTLDLAKKAIEFFEGFFDFPLPMRKLDVVSVRNVEFLAMENWGLLFFHEDYVPVSESTPLERQQRIARLVGHEVAHQWFGNLVALRWWRYIWLKEGLARYLEYVFTHTTFPKWEMWLHFVSDIQNSALIADASATKRHPVEQGTGLHPREITKLFDAISYGKAASIMRMVAHSIGGEYFMTAALKQFIHRHAYSSATSEDMFACLAEQYARAVVASKSPLPHFAMSPPNASITNINNRAAGGGSSSVSLEDMLSTWVSTSGPACILVRADKSMDDLSVPAVGPQLNLSIRVYACADATTGFTPAIANRPVSPQTRHDDFDPLLGGKRDRSHNSTRPSSVLVRHDALLKSMELPVPILVSVAVGSVCLPPEYAGVCEGHDTVLAVSVLPTTSASGTAAQGTGGSAPGSTTAASANAAGVSQSAALESTGSNNALMGDDGANNSTSNGNPLQAGGDRGASPPQVEGPISLIANASCHAPCRVDYDSVLWWRVVQTVMHRPVKERLGVAMNLFEQRTTLVGVLDDGEELDRCMLLLRFLFELGHHRETHAAMWGYMIEALSNFITLIQDQPCWPEVRLLIIFSQRHLLSARTIGFPAAPAPKDPVLDYNASHDMSSKHRAGVLHSLARCGEPEVIADAKSYVEWILNAFEDKAATAIAASTLSADVGASNANAIGGTSAGPAFGGGSFLEAGGDGLGGDLGGGLVPSPPSPMQFAPPTHLADVACALDDLPMDYVSIAFEAAIAHSDDARLWWATLQLLSYIMVGDAGGLNLSEAARAPLPHEQFHIDAKSVVSNDARKQCWLDALFPAVLALPLSEVRTAQIEVLQKFNSLNTSGMRVLFENSNLLIKFIESTTRAHPAYNVLQSARKFAKRHSANALVATLLAESSPDDELSETATSAAAESKETDRSALVPNCVWADYVNEHYSWYIKRHLIHQVAPADASLFSEIASKSLNATSAAAVGGDNSDEASDSAMKRCSI